MANSILLAFLLAAGILLAIAARRPASRAQMGRLAIYLLAVFSTGLAAAILLAAVRSLL